MKKLLLSLIGGLITFGTSAELPVPSSGSTRAGSDSFYGYMVYSSVDWDLGVYKINPGNGYSMFMVDPYEQLGFDLMPDNGWYIDGKLNGVSMFYMDPYTPMGYFYYSLDLSTGQVLQYDEYPEWFEFETVFKICTLNTDDGRIYGYAADTNRNDWKYYWGWASQNDPTNIHIIREAEVDENFLSLCYREDKKCFYGITASFDFVSINTAGEINYIKYAPYYENAAFYGLQSGLIWSPEDEVFYWNAQIYEFNYESIFGFLYSITEDGKFDIVEQYSMDQQFSFFFTTESYVDPNAPLQPIIDDIDINNETLSGTLTITLPSKFGSGEPLPSDITYTLLINEEIYSVGNSAPGSSVAIGFSVNKPGLYSLGIFVSADDAQSKTVNLTEYIGNDTPMAPHNVVLSPWSLTWNAVTTGVNGGYIDLKDLSYIVYINGIEQATVKSNSYTLDLFSNPELEKYVASVEAISSGVKGSAGVSNSIVAGKPLDLPLNFEPTEEQFEMMTVYNANEDSYLYEGIYDSMEITWELTPFALFSGGTEWANSYMDDYIFLPPVYLYKGADFYTLQFDCGMYSDWYPEEYLNVVFASYPYPTAVGGEIISSYTPSVFLKDTDWDEWDRVEQNFSVPEDGIYYIGFQCVSAPQQYGIYLKDIVLKANEAGVESILIGNEKYGPVYNLQGIKVADSLDEVSRGIYIVNGRKVVRQ